VCRTIIRLDRDSSPQSVERVLHQPFDIDRVAQLAIECIEPTPACYRAVGHSLGADRLMWAEIDPGDKIRVTVMFFDVSAGTTSKKVGTFDGVQAARAGIAELVAFAADQRSRSQ